MKKIAFILLIATLLTTYLWQKDRPTHAVQTISSWSTVDPSLVTGISISNDAEENIILHKKEAWMLGDKTANQEAIERMLEHLHEMRPIRVVTRNPKQYARLSVSDQSARIRLTDKKDHVLLDIHIGKPGSDLISTYVRLRHEKEVIAVNKALVWQVNRTKESWQAQENKTDNSNDQKDPYAHPL